MNWDQVLRSNDEEEDEYHGKGVTTSYFLNKLWQECQRETLKTLETDGFGSTEQIGSNRTDVEIESLELCHYATNIESPKLSFLFCHFAPFATHT